MRDDENAPKTLTGADALVAVAVASGVDVLRQSGNLRKCISSALARRPDELKSVLVLHENIASGAADGFARARKRTGGRAMTLLHCYVGLANALSNSHNASGDGVETPRQRRRRGHVDVSPRTRGVAR